MRYNLTRAERYGKRQFKDKHRVISVELRNQKVAMAMFRLGVVWSHDPAYTLTYGDVQPTKHYAHGTKKARAYRRADD